MFSQVDMESNNEPSNTSYDSDEDRYESRSLINKGKKSNR
jgi:hypothetical protein